LSKQERLDGFIDEYLIANGPSLAQDITNYCNTRWKLGYTTPEVRGKLARLDKYKKVGMQRVNYVIGSHELVMWDLAVNE